MSLHATLKDLPPTQLCVDRVNIWYGCKWKRFSSAALNKYHPIVRAGERVSLQSLWGRRNKNKQEAEPEESLRVYFVPFGFFLTRNTYYARREDFICQRHLSGRERERHVPHGIQAKEHAVQKNDWAEEARSQRQLDEMRDWSRELVFTMLQVKKEGRQNPLCLRGLYCWSVRTAMSNSYVRNIRRIALKGQVAPGNASARDEQFRM